MSYGGYSSPDNSERLVLSPTDYRSQSTSSLGTSRGNTPCTISSNKMMKNALRNIAEEYEIKMTMAQRLQQLEDYEIVIVCDDSGSMRTNVDNTQRTRWDELCDIVKIVLRIGVVFDSSGVDIYFINGRTFNNVKDPRQVDEAFKVRPKGYTPLVPVLRKIFQLPAARRGNDKKVLVFIATDGVPTDENGNENIDEFRNVMIYERNVDTTHISFLLCTDDPVCVKNFSKWDETMENVDVTDDFNTEKQTIQRYRGVEYPFSYGDYVVKALLGGIDPEIDALNEPTGNRN